PGHGGRSSTRAGADCTGAVGLIYGEAAFPYKGGASATYIPEDKDFLAKFRKLEDWEEPQVGDVARWKGPIAIYDPNAARGNDAESAYDSTQPFGPATIEGMSKYHHEKPTFYRYQDTKK